MGEMLPLGNEFKGSVNKNLRVNNQNKAGAR